MTLRHIPPAPLRHPGARPGLSLLLGLLGLAWLAAAQDPADTSRRRGQFLRTELLRTDTEPTYTCTLAPTSGSYPTLLFRRIERVRQHETRIYEAVVEERVTDAETGTDGITYRAVPGQEVRGETTTHETTRDLGAFANASFEVNGISVQTDTSGLYVDTAQRFLLPFDDLSTNHFTLDVHHADLGGVSSRITRYLTLRWQAQRPEERLRLVQTDLLVALGADFEPVAGAAREGLKVSVALPESATPGQECILHVEASNEGKRPVACLLGRTFGRHTWLSGLNLYLGNLPPGSRREFERVVRIPDELPPGPVYGVVGFWDILGPIPAAAQPLRCEIGAPPGTGSEPTPAVTTP